MILDTFYILFKSNTADLIKGNKEAQKSTQELEENIKKSGGAAEEFGKQYVKLIENATAAVTGLISVGAITRSIFTNSDANSALLLQSHLIGQNIVDLKAYGTAVEEFGGTQDEFRGNIQRIFETFASYGVKIGSVPEAIEKVRAELKKAGGDVAQQELILQRFGLTGTGFKTFLLLSDEEQAKVLKQHYEWAQTIEEGAAAARNFEREWSRTKTSLSSVFTALGSEALPVLSDVNKYLQDLFSYLQNNREQAPAVFTVITVGITAIAGAITTVLIPALVSASAILGTLLTGITLAVGGVAAIADTIQNGRDSVIGKSWFGKALRKLTNSIDGAIHGDDGYLRDGTEERFKSSSMSIDDAPKELLEQRRRRGIDSLIAAKSALDIASSVHFGAPSNSNTKNITVKTGDIHVNTAATDANGIAADISSDLGRQLQAIIGNLDDGVNY